MPDGYAPLAEPQKARTDIDCHECGRSFIAQLDFTIEGNHRIVCPRCGHIHFRVIKQGVITEERWAAAYQTTEVSPQCTWMSDVIDKPCSTATQFIRDAWLNRSDLDLS
jgi:DNA-directed RNA polymerase subunit RPC12/RpoP